MEKTLYLKTLPPIFTPSFYLGHSPPAPLYTLLPFPLPLFPFYSYPSLTLSPTLTPSLTLSPTLTPSLTLSPTLTPSPSPTPFPLPFSPPLSPPHSPTSFPLPILNFPCFIMFPPHFSLYLLSDQPLKLPTNTIGSLWVLRVNNLVI